MNCFYRYIPKSLHFFLFVKCGRNGINLKQIITTNFMKCFSRNHKFNLFSTFFICCNQHSSKFENETIFKICVTSVVSTFTITYLIRKKSPNTNSEIILQEKIVVVYILNLSL